MATPEEMWGYIPSGGSSTGTVLAELHSRALEMHQIQGLKVGVPLAVTQTSRTAGAIVQTISEAGGVVTVERTP